MYMMGLKFPMQFCLVLFLGCGLGLVYWALLNLWSHLNSGIMGNLLFSVTGNGL